MLRVAVVGASGYTGAELVRLLQFHPKVELTGAFGFRTAGKLLADVFPQFKGAVPLTLEAFSAAKIRASADVVFTALPHGASAPKVAELADAGLKIIDLSGDFRLGQADYDTWYGEGKPHPASALLKKFVYGLVEQNRENIKGSDYISCPGCYPTATTMPLLPLFQKQLVDTERPIIVDAKSGVSGAGREPSSVSHFAECGEGVSAYKPAGGHRHTPEIEQILQTSAGSNVVVTFTPHLIPMARGILSVSYLEPRGDITQAQLDDALVEYYRREPFVEVLLDTLPQTAFVRGSNKAHVAVRLDERANRIVAFGAIDNLLKGAAGQAVQCMNVMMGYEETAGLPMAAAFP